jgi:hypothetical protein
MAQRGSPLTGGKLEIPRRHANLGPLLAALALGATACAGAPEGPPAALDARGRPDLRAVPGPPMLEDPAERRAIGDALLADLVAQQTAAEQLRFRVGLIGTPPPPPPPAPRLAAPEVEPPPVARPSQGFVALLLRQQIRAEIDSDDLDGFLDRVAAEPIDVEALAALPPERIGGRSGGAPSASGRGRPTLLDRALGAAGVGPAAGP